MVLECSELICTRVDRGGSFGGRSSVGVDSGHVCGEKKDGSTILSEKKIGLGGQTIPKGDKR